MSQTSSSSPSIQSTANASAIPASTSSPVGLSSSNTVPSTQPLPETPSLNPQAPQNNESPSQSRSQPPRNRKPPAKKKEKSVVWLHFTRCKLPGSNDLNPKWCTCDTCGDQIPCDTRTNGTSSMWSHVYKKCIHHPLRDTKEDENDPKQSKLVVDNISGARTYHKYSKQRMDEKCIAMIIIDELPFRFVEKKGFRELMREARPEWPILNRKQVARGVYDLFNSEKAMLQTSLQASDTRISITTDTWTSIQNINYMVITAHFLDKDWKLHKRIISFAPIISHKGEDIGKAVDQCLRGWECTKIFTVTVDNASANDVAVQFIRRRLRQYNTLLFDGEFLHVRCACHIINLIVKDGLKELEQGIHGIQKCVKYIRSSPARLDKFREFAVEVGCKANANIPLDVVTRWNNTYLMLEAALPYETTFARMAEEDAPFDAYFEGKVGTPLSGDWKNAAAFCKFLKKFHETTVNLSAWKSVTSNVLFYEMIGLQTEIENACNSEDNILSRVGYSMREKFNKYWGNYEGLNKLVLIANVLDPRFKLMWSRVAMQRLHPNAELVETIESNLKSILLRMYNEYRLAAGIDISRDAPLGDDLDEYGELDEVSREMARRMAAEQSVCIRNEMDQYLSDRYHTLLKFKEFDVAAWWKVNEGVYPILSKLAKDIYAMPCSTVASENAFSLGSRVVDPFRSSLTPKMVEALVCSSDWLRGEPLNLSREPSEDDLEFYMELEDLEKEIAGLGTAGSTTGAAAAGGVGGAVEGGQGTGGASVASGVQEN